MPISPFISQNIRSRWGIYKPVTSITLLTPNPDFSLNIKNMYLNGYGGKPHENNELWEIDGRYVYNSTLSTQALSLGYGDNVYSDNTALYTSYPFTITGTFGDALTAASYTGTRKGTMYFVVGPWGSDAEKTRYNYGYGVVAGILFNSADDFYTTISGNGYLACKFTVSEAIDPTGIIVDPLGEEGVTINVGADGSYSSSVVTGSSWITITSGSGTNNGTVTLNVDPNYGVERLGTVKITTSSSEYFCDISQGESGPS